MIFHSGEYVNRFVSLLILPALEELVKPHDCCNGMFIGHEGRDTTSVVTYAYWRFQHTSVRVCAAKVAFVKRRDDVRHCFLVVQICCM